MRFGRFRFMWFPDFRSWPHFSCVLRGTGFVPGATALRRRSEGRLINDLRGRAQLQIDDSALDAYRDRMGPVLRFQFGEDVPDVALHGFFGQR